MFRLMAKTAPMLKALNLNFLKDHRCDADADFGITSTDDLSSNSPN